MELIQTLQKQFKTLSSSIQLLQEIEKVALIKNFTKETIILKEDSYVQFIPLVVKGLVKVYKEEENGNEVLLYYIKPGESCIMSIIAAEKNIPINVKGVVEDDAEIILIPIDKLNLIKKNHPKWNTYVYELFNEKFEEVIEMVKILTFSNKQKRLEEYLKTKAKLNNSDTILKSHQQIANELGSSREVISRLLKKLEKEKKVILHQKQIKIL
jgi:CRP/FNR family transcriptional regulator